MWRRESELLKIPKLEAGTPAVRKYLVVSGRQLGIRRAEEDSPIPRIYDHPWHAHHLH